MPRTLSTCLIFGLFAVQAFAAEPPAFFASDVAPTLEQHCISCHSGDDAKGGLDLTTRTAALAGGESGPSIIPGKPDDSFLLDYVSGDEPEMPKEAPPLSAEQVAGLRRWIADGVAWPEERVLKDKRKVDDNWWSLMPLADVVVPPEDDPWIRTPVDAFILAKLDEQGLSPSGEADRRTLIRRLTYDLHGLPPTPAEIDAFVADTRDDAYEQLVDRLLASPRYGERWGRHWLDVVHFGESHGYDKDKPRPNAWPYRDYVINSLNADKPYDQFVAEQIAGDVLCHCDPQATVATGFIAAGPWDFVGHVELREGTTDKDDRPLERSRRHGRQCDVDVREPDRALRPLPRSQVRSDPAEGLLCAAGRVCRRRSGRPAVRRRSEATTAERSQLLAREAVTRGASRVSQQPRGSDHEPRDRVRSTSRSRAWKPSWPRSPRPKASQTLGYHSQIMPAADTTKWVQVDLGQSLPIDEIVLVPAHVVYGGHPGPGFGFPPRFKVEVVRRCRLCDAAASLVDHTGARRSASRRHAGSASQPAASGRVRAGDGHEALGANRRLDLRARRIGRAFRRAKRRARASQSQGSTQSKPRQVGPEEPGRRIQQPEEFVAGEVGCRNGARSTRSDSQAATDTRQRLVERVGRAGTRNKLVAGREAQLPVRREIAALPEQQMVYAAAHDFKPQGSFTPSRAPADPPAGPRRRAKSARS